MLADNHACRHRCDKILQEDAPQRPRGNVRCSSITHLLTEDEESTDLMEGDCPNVVQVPQQREETPPQLIVPHFDLVVVSAGHKQRLRAVEVNPTHGTIVLVEAIDQRSHAVVP